MRRFTSANVLPAFPIPSPQLKPCGKTPYNSPGPFQPEDREPGRIYLAKAGCNVWRTIDSPCYLYRAQILEVLLKTTRYTDGRGVDASDSERTRRWRGTSGLTIMRLPTCRLWLPKPAAGVPAPAEPRPRQRLRPAGWPRWPGRTVWNLFPS